MLGRLIRWIGDGRRAGALRRQALGTEDVGRRAELLRAAVELDDLPSLCLEAAVALAQAGGLDESAECWIRALKVKPGPIPTDEQIDALHPVLPRAAREVLGRLEHGPDGFLDHRWMLERRGSFDGEERWRLEQEEIDEMERLAPTLRYVALLVAHTSAAPGRVRIDCDLYDRDTDSYQEIRQLGEAIMSWDENRRISGVQMQR